MRTLPAVLLFGLMTGGCDLTGPLPEPMRLPGLVTDTAFPVKPRPACTDAVTAARGKPDPRAIARVASDGGVFTCGPLDSPLPLDEAVLHDAPDRVRALLEAGADPNARWLPDGDRFPLQEAIEAPMARYPNRPAIVRLLLQHGADPNARWCPSESRGGFRGWVACRSKSGWTALISASALNQADITYLLLDAGADATLEAQGGYSALDHARSEAVFELLAWALFPDRRSHDAATLEYLNDRKLTFIVPGPWNETPLARAITVGGVLVTPEPPLRAQGLATSRPPRPPSAHAAFVRAILGIGADPNQRSSGPVDWTPLRFAVVAGAADVVDVLLNHGADPNARWCVTSQWEGGATTFRPMAGCELARGMTPLMLAASMERIDLVELLLQHGADPALRDWQDKTAVDHAGPTSRERVARAINGR